jgi:apolipoprotein N-acyltransferase
MNFWVYNWSMFFRTILFSLCALLAGALLALSTPLFEWYVCAPIGLVLFFLLYQIAPPRLGLVLSLITFLLYSIASGEVLFRLVGSWWVNQEGTIDATSSYTYFSYGLVAISTFAYVGALRWCRSYALGGERPFVIALAIMLAELVRTGIYFGYTWGALGLAFIDVPYVKYVVLLFGVHGLTFLAVLVCVYIAERMLEWWGNRREFVNESQERVGLGRTRAHMLMWGGILCVILFGIYQEHGAPFPKVGMRVGVIASTITTEESILPGAYRTYRALIQEAILGGAELVVTPENVLPFFMIDETTQTLTTNPMVWLPESALFYEDFLQLSRQAPSTTIALGVHTHSGASLYNSIVYYKGGEIVDMYHKRKPVPITEYAPLGLPLPIFATFTHGEDSASPQHMRIPVSEYICSEIDVLGLRAYGAPLIISPSNDSALASDTIAPLHHQMAKLKAISAHAYMVRSSKGGVSAVINPRGETMSKLTEQSGVILIDLP